MSETNARREKLLLETETTCVASFPEIGRFSLASLALLLFQVVLRDYFSVKTAVKFSTFHVRVVHKTLLIKTNFGDQNSKSVFTLLNLAPDVFHKTGLGL